MTTTPGLWVAKSRATGGYNIVAVDDVLEDVVVGTAVLGDHSMETAHANAQMLAASKRMYEVFKELNPEALAIILGETLADEIATILQSIDGTP